MPAESPPALTKSRIPVTLVTGFLGSGKTTLINAALRSNELAKTVVVVNEFGEVGLDHQLFASSSDSVVVLENIYRHLELGEPPAEAAYKGGQEVALPVLAATLTTVVVFFPVTFLYGVSKFLFSALALAVAL